MTSPQTVKSDTTLVIIPTFNEIENLPLITKRVREATPEVHILIVDDSSPDGTGELADEYAGKDDHVHVIHRESKDGLLGAYIAGFKWGLERDYQVLKSSISYRETWSRSPMALTWLLAPAMFLVVKPSTGQLRVSTSRAWAISIFP